MKKSISIILILTMLLISIPSNRTMIYAGENGKILSEGEKQTLVHFEDSYFYLYSNNDFSYCSQISPDGKMIYAIYEIESDSIYQSEIIDIQDTFNADFLVKLNTDIINNLEFRTCVQVDHTPHTITSSSSTISDAIADLYGSDYTNRLISTMNKSQNGSTYTVRCKESQTTSYTTSSRSFAKETALSVIIAWVIAGSWEWEGIIMNILYEVITMIMIDGLYYTVKAFSAQKSDVTILRTRIAVIGSDPTAWYWAGWTQKRYFIKGDMGWTSDANAHYDRKHPDYDDTHAIMTKGLNEFLGV